jgi:hypothetical protein
MILKIKMRLFQILLFHLLFHFSAVLSGAQTINRDLRCLAIGENGGHHLLHTQAAKIWLNKLAADSNFTIDYYTNTKPITKEFLGQYQLFIQIDYPPYSWSKESEDAFIEYIEQGKEAG